MPDAVPFTDPSMSAATGLPPPLTAVDDDKTKATETRLKDIEQKEESAEDKVASGISGLSKRYQTMMADMVKQQGVEANDLKPWNAKQELADRQPNLWEQFGSPAFLISMLGSAFAARPMNAALEAGGAAIKAANEGAEDSYNKAFQAWKDNSDLAIKRVNLEHTEFEEIQNLYKNDLEAFQAAMRAHLSKFGHERALAMMDMGYFPQVVEAQAKMGEVARQASEAQFEILQNNAASKEIKRRVDAGENQFTVVQDVLKKMSEAQRAGYGANTLSKDKEETIKALQAEIHKKHPELSAIEAHLKAVQQTQQVFAPGMTATQKDKLQAQVDGYTNGIDLIRDLKDRIKKFHGSVGIFGMASRTGERLSDVLAGSSEADRVQIMRDLDRLKLGASRLLLDAQGRPLASSEKLIDDIIGGGNYGDTTVNSLRSLDTLMDTYSTMLKQHRERLPGEDESGARVDIGEPKESSDDWSGFPEVK